MRTTQKGKQAYPHLQPNSPLNGQIRLYELNFFKACLVKTQIYMLMSQNIIMIN